MMWIGLGQTRTEALPGTVVEEGQVSRVSLWKILQDLVTNGHMRMKMGREMEMRSEEQSLGGFGVVGKMPSLAL
jgi:hypothetical protein